jgi:hypothetical protein
MLYSTAQKKPKSRWRPTPRNRRAPQFCSDAELETKIVDTVESQTVGAAIAA